MRELLARLDDPVVAFDRDLAIVFFNAAAERLFGRSAPEVVGHDTRILEPTDLQIRARANRETRLRGISAGVQDYLGPDGEPITINYRTCRVTGQAGVMGRDGIEYISIPRRVLWTPPGRGGDQEPNSGVSGRQNDHPMVAVTERAIVDHSGPPPRRMSLEDMRHTLSSGGSFDDLSPDRVREIEANLNADFERERNEWIRRTFAARLRAARQRARVSQSAAAAIAGGKTRRNEINRWEHASARYARLPRYDTRNRLADGLGVPRAHFIPELEVDG